MARGSMALSLLSLVLLVLATHLKASDPELVEDFMVLAGMNASDIDGSFFTFTGIRMTPTNASPGTFKPVKAFMDVFPALSGLGISTAFLEFQPTSLNVPHTHPRATELLYVIDGTLMVGLVDSTNKMYNQTLEAGDLFVFPKGLVHFQVNPSTYKASHALASFSSANPGTVSLPSTLFGSDIDTTILSKAFQVSTSVLAQLEAPFPMQ